MIFEERPTVEDYLWTDNPDVEHFRTEVVRTISEGEPRSQTVAIHGRWGSGKTTLWKQIRRRLEEEERRGRCAAELIIVEISVDRLVRAVRPQGEDDSGDSFFVHLVRNIVLSMSEENCEELFEKIGLLAKWREYVPEHRSKRSSRGRYPRVDQERSLREQLPNLERFLAEQKFEVLVGQVFASLPSFTSWLERKLKEWKKRLVVCVDDLDRCEASYVSSVVRTLRSFREIDGVYVFLLVDKQILREAFELVLKDFAGIRTVDEALERYINVSFRIPALDARAAAAFAAQIASRARIELYEDLYYFLSDMIPAERLTPRTVINLLNSLSLRLPVRGSRNLLAEPDLLKRRIKMTVLEQYYEDIMAVYERDWKAFAELEGIFAEKYRSSYRWAYDSALITIIRNVTNKHNLSEKVAEKICSDSHLQEILAKPPYLYYSDSQNGGDGSETGSETPPPPASSGSQSTVDVNVSPIRHEIEAMFTEVAAALLARNRGALERLLPKLLSAQLSSAEAPAIASLAQIARQVGLIEYAVDLFDKAHTLNPDHEDILQAYIALIIEERLQDRYQFAATQLDRLLRGEVPKDDYAFTLALAVRWAILNQLDYTEYLQRLLEEWAQRKEIAIFRRVAVALNAVKSRDERTAVEQFCRMYREALDVFHDDAASLYLAHRSAADFLASLNNPEYERQAMDLYRDMVSGKIAIEEDDRADILHNYATLLYKYDYDAEAGRMWYEAYRLAPLDANIRRGFGAYLFRYGSQGLSELVYRGVMFPREELPRIPERRLPERFARNRPCGGE